jgi:hypothetical protein
MLCGYASSINRLYYCLPLIRAKPGCGDAGILDVEYGDGERLELRSGRDGEIYNLEPGVSKGAC